MNNYYEKYKKYKQAYKHLLKGGASSSIDHPPFNRYKSSYYPKSDSKYVTRRNKDQPTKSIDKKTIDKLLSKGIYALEQKIPRTKARELSQVRDSELPVTDETDHKTDNKSPTVREIYLSLINDTLSDEILDEYYNIIQHYLNPNNIKKEKGCNIISFITIKLNKLYQLQQESLNTKIIRSKSRFINRELQYLINNPHISSFPNYWSKSQKPNVYTTELIPDLELYESMPSVTFTYNNKPLDILFKQDDKHQHEIILDSFFFYKKNPPSELKTISKSNDPNKNWTCNLLSIILNWFDIYSNFNKVTLMDASFFNSKKCKPPTIMYLIARDFGGMYQCVGFKANPEIDVPYIQTLLNKNFDTFLKIPMTITQAEMRWI